MQAITYGTATINEFKAEDFDHRGRVNLLSINGQKVEPTPRFWTSLCSMYSNYGLTTKLFTLFTHHEVFERITHRVGGVKGNKDRLRYALEEQGAGNPKLLAVTNPNKPLIQYDRIRPVLANYGAPEAEYGTGIVRSNHVPAHMDKFEISGDSFTHGYVLETPIDGFGKPLIYLSLLRQVCSNGAIGYARAFRTEIQIGRGNSSEADTMHSITRCLDSFNNEDGYAALRQRFESATESWASIYECSRILKVLNKMAQHNLLQEPNGNHKGQVESLAFRRAVATGLPTGLDDPSINPINGKVIRAASQLFGDLCAIYGVTHLDALSEKRMRKLPAKCKVYELLNFTTEVATHYCNEQNGRLLQAEVGSFVSSEYDLEGSASKEGGYETFADWHIDTGTDMDATQN